MIFAQETGSGVPNQVTSEAKAYARYLAKSTKQDVTVLHIVIAAQPAAFVEAMDDDFNSAGALGHLFDLVRVINQARDAGLAQEAISKAQDLLRELMGVFGLRIEKSQRRNHWLVATVLQSIGLPI